MYRIRSSATCFQVNFVVELLTFMKGLSAPKKGSRLGNTICGSSFNGNKVYDVV